MRRLLAFLLITAIVVAGAVWLADRPGEVTIRWQGWRADTSVPVLLAVLVVLVAALSLLGRLLRLVFGAPGRFLAARRARRTRKGYVALSDGLAAVAAGDSRQAAKLARRADKLLADSAVTGLLSVQAAQMSGDADALRSRFQAMTERSETAYLGHRGLMDQALKAGERKAALDHGARAFTLQPGAEGLAAGLFELQLEAGQWPEAALTLATARRHSALTGDDPSRLRALLLFARAEAAQASGDTASALSLAEDARDCDPSLVPAVVLAAALLGARGKLRKAAALILSAFKTAPHPDLVAQWAALGPNDSALERVKRMQKLVEANPASPDGHMGLAEAALAAKLWGQARTHLDKARDQRPTLRTLTLLARLEREERKDEAAAVAWLAKAGEAKPESAWTCGSCGHPASVFSVNCPACHAAGRMEWR
ncbi:hypothetical protein CU669_00765 [Paramagnetospirillum kuznetsovii]|uniref:HemY N-terminal domain-containing protein n=1 Tax=Paramagnetospirillum kuznetsovii TaxID=2053833 RepID=A0A364P318_9PROT|nr:heme biosynthesis HemY N-terminal domain-containing protein [Paramagnetospirillum kuznetsovii]RAU23670.1 hypothetical protein CU669_00765 [Paramagnetospirillum kuznetsovii]